MTPSRKGRKPRLEVRSLVDGGWYDGDVVLDGSRLRVHFSGFGEEDDEFWEEEFLRSTAQIKGIMRLRSKQLQDSQCSKVLVGMVVCANYKTADGSESKYYDAKVIEVHPSEHSFQKRGKAELCKCRFKVAWIVGPDKDQDVLLGCAEISLIATEGVEKHPVVEQILRGAYDCAEESRDTTVELEDMVSWDDVLTDDLLMSIESRKSDDLPLNQTPGEILIESGQIQEFQVGHKEFDILQTESKPIDCVVHEEGTGDAFTSMQTEGLPLDVIAKLENYATFDDFLGKQVDKLEEVLDRHNARR